PALLHEACELGADAVDLRAVLLELGLARAPLCQQGPNEDEALQVQHQLVHLTEVTGGPRQSREPPSRLGRRLRRRRDKRALVLRELDHAASSATSASACSASATRGRDSVSVAARTAPAAAIAASA